MYSYLVEYSQYPVDNTYNIHKDGYLSEMESKALEGKKEIPIAVSR